MNLTISLAQMVFEFGKPATNLSRVEIWTEEAARRGSDLVLFPELWSSGYDLEHTTLHAERIEAGHFARLAELAKKHRIKIGSSLLERDTDRYFNTFTVFDDQGGLLAAYRKIHLFRLLEEEQYLEAGEKPVSFDPGWGRTGLAVCYDLRFPELFRRYASRGTRLMLIVAEWPEDRIAHWETLLAARAIENQTFIAAVNKVGTSKDAKLGGRSMIVNPMGDAIAKAGDKEIMITARVDLQQVDRVRKWMPVLDDARLDLDWSTEGDD